MAAETAAVVYSEVTSAAVAFTSLVVVLTIVSTTDVAVTSETAKTINKSL